MTTKAVTVYATVLDGAKYSAQNTQEPGAIATFDRDKEQTVIGILAIGATNKSQVQLLAEGNIIYSVDGTMFSATYGPLPVEIVYKRGMPITIDLVNSSGGTLTSIPITVWYKV